MGKAMGNATVRVFPGLNFPTIYTAQGYLASKNMGVSTKQQLIFVYKIA